MEMNYVKQYSPALGRDMECKIYGHGGRPVLYIPCQDGRFFDFENFHMHETWAPWIDRGDVIVFAIDTTGRPGRMQMEIRTGEFVGMSSGFAISRMRWCHL